MKQAVILLTILFASCAALAQETEKDTLQTETEPKKGLWQEVTSLYVGLGTEAAPAPEGTAPSLQLQFGAEFKKFHFGFVFSDYDGNYEQRLIFPNQFSLLYRHGGAYLGRRIWSSNLFRINGLIQWSHGDVVWQRVSTREGVFRDKMTLWQPTLQLEVNPEFLVAGYINVGYRQMTGLDLPQLSTDDFSGLTVQFGIRLGLFRKTQKLNIEDEEGL